MTPSDVSVTIPHAMTQKNTKYLTVRVDDELHAKLAELANLTERAASSEARLAIRTHVDAELARLRPSIQRMAGDDRPTA